MSTGIDDINIINININIYIIIIIIFIIHNLVKKTYCLSIG